MADVGLVMVGEGLELLLSSTKPVLAGDVLVWYFAFASRTQDKNPSPNDSTIARKRLEGKWRLVAGVRSTLADLGCTAAIGPVREGIR
jgi:hypothetical protein